MSRARLGDVRRYRTWLFDCDGVILDSNQAKTDAFRQVVAPYGEAACEAFLAHHVAHGGMSRWAKFEHLFAAILQRPPEHGEVERLAAAFGARSAAAILAAPEDPAARPLFASLRRQGCRVYVVSGGAHAELAPVLAERGLDTDVDGVYGSPTPKVDLVAELDRSGMLERPGVFVGDSRIDHEVAVAHGLDFVFVSRWTEWDGWAEALPPSVPVVDGLAPILAAVGG